MNISQSIASARGLRAEDAALAAQLVKVWQQKRTRNQLRSRYYEMHKKPRDLGISTPPKLRNLEQVIGWSAKAVDYLADRSQFDGFVCDDAENDAFLQKVVRKNGLVGAYRKACISELTHSCSFLTVTAINNEPIIRAYPATASAAIWDYEKNRIKAGLVVVDFNHKTSAVEPSWVNVFTDDNVIQIMLTAEGWQAQYIPHSMGRCLIEPLAYSATLERPFGKSRISRAVMNITDDAMRAAVRSEISSEFFTSPQKFLLGADKEALDGLSKWDAYIGNLFAVSRDSNDNTPEFGQLPQGSMQPHIDYMRSLAARFSGETNVPISSLGIVSDNPSSAEAIYAAKEDMVIDAQNLNADNGEALRNVALMALAIKEKKSFAQINDEVGILQTKFKNPAMPSLVSQSDAMIKMVTAMPWMATSDVILEELGFSDDKIQRLKTDRAKESSRMLLNLAVAQAKQMEQPGEVD